MYTNICKCIGRFSGVSIADRMGSTSYRMPNACYSFGRIHLYGNVLAMLYSTPRVFLLLIFLMFVASLEPEIQSAID